MSLRKYQAFVETVRLGSLTRAAQSLGSTQSRISHILSDLEEEFGLPLLNRSRSGIQLTQAGKLLLPKMQAILQEDSALQTLARDIRQADAGTIRLGAFTSVAVHWLPGIIRDFQARHPRVELKLFNGDYADMERWLEKGEIDVGFVTLPAPGPVRTIPLAQDPLVVILPRGHRLCALEAIPPEELRGEDFISLLQDSAHDTHLALDEAGISPHIKFTTKDDYAILAMVEQGLGIAIVPQLLLKGHREDLAVRPLTPGVSRTIALALPHEGEIPAVEAFCRSVTAWLRENPQ